MNPLPPNLFDNIANLFYNEQITNSIKEFVEPAQGLTLLDAPCGSGTLHEICVPCTYYGIDMDADRVEKATESYSDGIFSISDAANLDFPDDKFDRILAAGLFHHVDDETAFKIVNEFGRLLKPDGKLIVFEAIWPRNRFNLFGYAMRKMDQGNYVRTSEQYLSFLNELFAINNETYLFRLGIDYYLTSLRLK